MNMVAIHTAHLLKTSSHKTIASLFIQGQKRKLLEQRKVREREAALHRILGSKKR